MPKRIWKFKLMVTDRQVVEMPKWSDPLFVQYQSGDLCLWALCDPSEPTVSRLIRIVGTGHDSPDSRNGYIGTTQSPNGLFVWHVFDCGEND